MGKLLTFLFILYAAPCWGTFTEVGSGSQRATATSSTSEVASLGVAFPANVTSGNLIIVGGNTWASAGPASSISVTDTIGTTYTVVTSTIGGDKYLQFIAYGVTSSSGANTVTVDPNINTFIAFAIDEFSGQNATPLDVDGSSSTGTSTAPADSITTGVANALIIGVAFHDGSVANALDPTGSYTQIGEEEDNNVSVDFNLVYRIATTATSYTVDWTLGSSASWLAQTISFAPSVASSRKVQVIIVE